MAVRTGGIPFWMTYKRSLPQKPSYDFASRYLRIPRPPVEDQAGSTPGLICWGAAGAMPSAEPLPTVDFNVKSVKREISRKSENVRIENPDDPSQYVIADRATEITFQGATNTAPPSPNTATKKAEVEDLLATQGKWVEVGGGAQGTGQETFTYRKEAL